MSWLLLLYNADAILVLIGYRHTGNCDWHSCVMSKLSTDSSFYACRNDVISTGNSFMHVGIMSFCRQIVYKFMRAIQLSWVQSRLDFRHSLGFYLSVGSFPPVRLEIEPSTILFLKRF